MSDDLDTYPVHRIEGTATRPIIAPTDESRLYQEPAYARGQFGPYNQTLFLGCSISNFNVNLGWGSEASTLSVSLVEDDSAHWNSPQSILNDNQIAAENFKAINTPLADKNQKSTFNSYNTSFPTPVVGDIRTDKTSAPAPIPLFNVRDFSGTGQGGGLFQQPISQDLHRTILFKEEFKRRSNIIDNNYLSVANPSRADLGKVYYDINLDGSYTKKYWTDKDPGFIGETYDILGVAVRFIFNDFEFIGIVTSWKNNGSSSGKNLYTVEIKSFSTLLKNTQLIIDYYPGTIFSKSKTTPKAFELLDDFGFPSNHVGNRLNTIDSTDALNSNYDKNDFIGTIPEGNIPNVFNIYGYLESLKGWGKHDINSEGTVVRDILVAMDDLINKSDFGSSQKPTGDTVKLIDARFSPYGRIVGKTPALTKQTTYKDSKEYEYSSILFLKDQYQLVQPQNELFKRLKEVPILPSARPSSNKAATTKQILEPHDFSNNLPPLRLKLNQMGLIPTIISSDNVYRQHYTIDFSSLPVVPSGFRIPGPVVSILDLVNHICEANNHDYFVDFIPTGLPVGRNTIKIRTISRQKQPPNNYLSQVIKDTTARNVLTSYDYGLEFNDDATLRSLYIGSRQKRLLQLTSNFLSRKNNTLIFDPKAGDELDFYSISIKNALRAPDHLSTRNKNYTFYDKFNNIDPNVGSGTGSIVYDGPTTYSSGENALWDWGTKVGEGNYHKIIFYGGNSELAGYKDKNEDVFKDVAQSIFSIPDEQIGSNTKKIGDEIFITPKSNYPLWDDFICPYFGLDIDGNARMVSYDTTMQQIQILCSVADIQNILGFALTKALNITSKQTEKKDSEGNKESDPEPPKESSVTSYPDSEFKGISDLNNPQNTSRQMCANLSGPSSTISTFHTQWNVTSREFTDGNEKFLLLENEIRAAIAGFDSWVYYTFNKNFTTDLGVLLRYALVSRTGLIVEEKANDEYSKTVNNGEPVISMVFHGPDPHLVGEDVAASPNSSASMMNDRVSDMLQKVHSYVKNIGDTYYGKQFMVKVPGLTISRDKPQTSIKDFDIVHSGSTIEVEQYNGQGALYPNYKPAKDGAWEEVGNVIDDTIIIGSITGDFFTTDDGRFGPLLGYRATYEYLNDTIPDITIDKQTKPDTSSTIKPSESIKFVNISGNKTNYTSMETLKSPGFKSWQEISNGMLTTTPMGEDGQTPNKNPPTLAMILALSSQPATGTDIIPNEWYPSVVTSMNNNEYLYMPYAFPGHGNITQLGDFTFADNGVMYKSAYDKDVPVSDELKKHLLYKLYAKGSIEDNFIFIKPYTASQYREPRAIITISAPVEQNPVHLASKYVHHCLMLDSTIFKLKRGATTPNSVSEIRSIQWRKNVTSDCEGTVIGGLFPYKGGFGASTNIITNATDHFLDALNAVDKDANKAVTMPIAPKAAMPGFAAVPLESQAAVYGPWTNYPWLVRKEIFTNTDISQNNSYLKDSIQNLVGGLKVNVVEELSPWKFGGMKNLDMEAIARVENDSNYQLQQEYGTVSFPGSPIYRIGDFVDLVSSMNSGPIISAIRTNISDGGVSTEYSLRTFTRKFGLFNKENATRAAQIGAERLSRRKAIAAQAAEIGNRIAVSSKTQTLNDAAKRDFTNPPLPESWRSSSELLVGHNDFYVRLPLLLRDNAENQGLAIDAINKNIKYDSSWPFNPIWTSGRPEGSGFNVLDYPKIFSNTQIMDNREALNILETSYENTSFMSLDGLLSPISFYPTENARTYHITKYPRKACRYCFGKGKIKYSDGIPGLKKSLDATTVKDLEPTKTQERQEKSILCPFCEPEINKAESLLQGAKRGRIVPPFILTTESDKIDTKSQTDSNGNKIYKTVGTVINYSTLNPAILSYGEFSAFQNRQSGDFTGNSIRMLGIGTIPPNKESDSLNQIFCSDNRLAKSNLEYDQLYLDKVKELFAIPAEKRSENIQKLISSLPERPIPFSNNARFFGFRGPMMVHGWGYDTEGYPVPNSSGELQYKSDGTPKTVKNTEDENDERYVYKNQKFIKLQEDDNGTPRDSSGLTADDLKKAGIVIVNGADGEGEGYYSAPYKEPTFARGWAQIPSTWPVGPVDLRWDEKAKVWTMPSTYKNVYVLLEEDLNNKNIARGELIDNSINLDNNILALGYRKTVFVKDNMGIYAAPRSSIIYCAYDHDGGFYEPISQNSFVTSGTILSSNTANIYKLFFKKTPSLSNNIVNSNNEPNYYVGKFSNPLNLNIDVGDTALFLYTRNGWIVQSNGGG